MDDAADGRSEQGVVAEENRDGSLLDDWLLAVSRITVAVNGDAPLPALLDDVARTPCELLGYDFCAVTLPDPERSVLLIRGSHGLSPEYVTGVNAEHPIRLQESEGSPSSQAFLTVSPHQVEDALHDPGFRPWGGVAKEQGYSSVLSVPLVASGSAIGTLNCYTTRRHRAEPEEIRLVTMLADQAANAITTAQLRRRELETIDRLHSANEELVHRNDLQRHSMQIHERFTAQALGGGGLPDIVTALAAVIGAPVAVHDADGAPLGAAAHEGWSLPAQLTAARDQQTVPATPFPDRRRDLQRTEIDGEGVLFQEVLLQDEAVARIWVGDPSGGLTELDHRAIEHASTVLSLELLRLRAVAESTWRDTGEVLTALLGATGSPTPALRERAFRLGHDLGRPHTMILTRLPSRHDTPSIHRIAQLLTHLQGKGLPRPLAGRHGEHLLILWPQAPDPSPRIDPLITQLRRALNAQGTDELPPSVVAGPLTDLSDIASALRSATGAVALAELRGTDQSWIALERMGVPGLLLQIPDPTTMQSFLDRVLGPLLEYDTRHRTELLATLRVLLRQDLSAVRAAEELFIHKNTITQRRHRIEEVLGLSLGSTESLVDVATALRVLDVLEARPRSE